MSRRTLACSVSASVYDQFRALLPEGVDVNGQLTNLVEHFIAGVPTKVDLDALKAKWRSEWAADLAKLPPPEFVRNGPGTVFLDQNLMPPDRRDQPDTAPMAVYDPDRPIQEQIDALGPGGMIQMPDYPVATDHRGLERRFDGPVPDPPGPLTERTDPISTSTVALAAAEQDAARAFLNADTCLHPHETLVRDGRFVRCTLCDRIIR